MGGIVGTERVGVAYIMHQHALNPILQCNSATITGAARPPQFQLDSTSLVVKASIFDITPIILDCGADPRIQQLLDHAYNLGIAFLSLRIRRCQYPFVFFSSFATGTLDAPYPVRAHGAEDYRGAAIECLREEGEDLGLEVAPGCITSLGHSHVGWGKEDGGDAI